MADDLQSTNSKAALTMPRYLAITFGPIYKTFLNVRKTRELWAASYIFSYLSRRLIEKTEQQYPGAVLVPHYEPKPETGVGLYPDRVFIKAGNGLTIQVLKDFADEVLQEIAGWAEKPGSLPFLQRYFRIHIIAFEAAENPLILGNKLLDTAELRSSWEPVESRNELLHFFRGVNKQKDKTGKWIEKHFQQKDIFGEVRFESVTEISTRAIRQVNEEGYKRLVKRHCYLDSDEDDAGFMADLQHLLNMQGRPEVFKNYHKYLCIVNADGDKVGTYIKAITGSSEQPLAELSKALHRWGAATAQRIREYSGVPIYVGGDDILFLAPVVGQGGKTILQLAEALNTLFTEQFKTLPPRNDEKGNLIKPTLSFGVSITYYKFPLYEALAKAGNLLHKAKQTRNAAALSLLKHSGSSFDITLSNDDADAITKAFLNAGSHFTADASFLSSIIHHFRENELVYSHIGTSEEKVQAYLLNNFEEEKHRAYVLAVAGLCYAVYRKNASRKGGQQKETTSRQSVRELYSYLRILKFLNGLDDGK